MKQRIIAVLCAGALSMVALSAPTISQAAAPAAPDTRGLFGAADPTYDGVYRQSMAILGLAAVGADVPPAAIQWLLRQQCADGSFASYRPNPDAPCPSPDATAYTGPDTNSTSAALLALREVSTGPAKKDPVAAAADGAERWLRRQQTPGGGWQWIAGLGPDAVSTGMVITSLSPGSGKAGVSGSRWLAQQVNVAAGCSVTFQPGAAPDGLTAAWTFISTQGALPYDPVKGSRSTATCPDRRAAARGAGAWLAGALLAGKGTIASAFDPAVTDWNATALATLSMTQRNGSAPAMQLGLAALRANVTTYAGSVGQEVPAALGTLLLVAQATSTNPRSFGGVNLVTRLLATLQR